MIVGRITKGVGGLYFADTGKDVYECRARGLFRRQNKTPCVGDFVDIDVIDSGKKTGYLIRIHDRKNELIRPRVTNIDIAIVVFSVTSPSLNLTLLDRFIVLIERQGLDIVLCFNKTDLVSIEEFDGTVKIYSDIGYPVIPTSAYEKDGIPELLSLIKDKVSVFAGPSGVGKSSLVNVILSDSVMETGTLSKIERGKHTTRHAEFLRLKEGGFIVDTPGFASLTTEGIPSRDLKYYFREFSVYEGKCRFSDCVHDSEPECALKAAIGDGISDIRYQSYLHMLRKEDNDV